MTRVSSDDAPDDALIDRAMADFLRDLAAGRVPDLDGVLPERPDLRARVAEAWALAKEISPPRRHDAGPTFPGYEILGELGRGGMGQVLLARDVRLGRKVALKMLPRRLATGRARERFEREARAVARLQHPLIVPVYEMGESDGQPYFTLQYMEGRTLAAALASLRGKAPRELTGRDLAAAAGITGAAPEPWSGEWWRAAARVAVDAAEALSHAHAQGVVHRDVKPSNIMLRDDGFALLFDFGLADVEDEAALTQTHGFLGTPHYASPEQAAGETASLDGRSDVWSLGATLYEALTLQVPFPGPVPHEVLRRIQTWEPEPPSKANPSIPRDLETVVLAALEKDRGRRTQSARQFADDVGAVLAGRRVRARRAGVLERGLRAVKRNRALTELLVEQQSRNAEMRSAVLRAELNEKLAREARAETEAALRRADEVTEFLRRTLASADPSRDGREVRVADLLARSVGDVRREFADRPATAASLLVSIAESLYGLGRYAEAAEAARHAATTAAPLGADHPLAMETENVLANCALIEGRVAEGVERLSRLARRAAGALGPDHAGTVRYLANLGHALVESGSSGPAEEVLRDALPRASGTLGADHRDTLAIQNNLGRLLSEDPARLDAALEVLGECAARRVRTLGLDHPDTLVTMANLAMVQKRAGRPDASEKTHREAVARAKRLLGEEHATTLTLVHNLAGVLIDLGRFDEAASLQRAALAGFERAPGTGGHLPCIARRQLAEILERLGRFDEAQREARAAWCAWRTLGPSFGRFAARSAAIVVRSSRASGRIDEARSAAAEGLAEWREASAELDELKAAAASLPAAAGD